MIPAIFVSHGAPTLAIDPGRTGPALTALGKTLPRPTAILVASAHWETAAPRASTAERPETIHDFGGFPDELFRIQYPAPGAPQLATRAVELTAGQGARVDPQRGLDHGAWVPLRFLYPLADVPVAQISIQPAKGPRHAYEIGKLLAPLRDEGALVLASGSIVHNLGQLDWGGKGAPPSWATEFVDWFAQRMAASDIDALLDYRVQAPHAVRAHPTDEHLLPLFTALGAAGMGAGQPAPMRRMELGYTFGSLAMDVFLFG